MSAPTTPARPLLLLSYMDVVLIVLAAPIMLLIGVAAGGYLIAAVAWIVLRVVGIAVERYAGGSGDARTQVGARLGYMLGRLFALALTIVFVRRGLGKDDGLAALVVIVFAFTVQLTLMAISKPRSR